MFRALGRTRRSARGGRPAPRPVTGLLLAATAVVGFALTGCAADLPAAGPTTGAGAPSDPVVSSAAAAAAAPATTQPATPHNEVDVSFANSMIPHNVQVLASSQIASSRAVTPQVKALAGKLTTAQVPQIEAMSAWLANWGQPVPAGGTAPNSSAGITQNDLMKLSQATPAGFDKLWLTTMIKHEQSAVTLAQNELKHGTATEAKALAKRIVAEQQSQIAAMKGLLVKA